LNRFSFLSHYEFLSCFSTLTFCQNQAKAGHLCPDYGFPPLVQACERRERGAIFSAKLTATKGKRMSLKREKKGSILRNSCVLNSFSQEDHHDPVYHISDRSL